MGNALPNAKTRSKLAYPRLTFWPFAGRFNASRPRFAVLRRSQEQISAQGRSRGQTFWYLVYANSDRYRRCVLFAPF